MDARQNDIPQGTLGLLALQPLPSGPKMHAARQLGTGHQRRRRLTVEVGRVTAEVQ